jgi:hypothetical protein
MALHLFWNGHTFPLFRSVSGDELQINIETAIREKAPLTVRLVDGGRLILNPEQVDCVMIWDAGTQAKPKPPPVGEISTMILRQRRPTGN